MDNNRPMTPDDIEITRFINTIFNNMYIKNKEQYDIFDVCVTLHKHSQKIDCINDMLISNIVKNLFKTIKTENIWKVFIILYTLAELSSDKISLFYQYNIYNECKKHNIYNWNDAKIIIQNKMNKLKSYNNVEDISNIFIGYLFVGIESMAYYGDKNFSLYESELAIYEWITGFGNFVEYNNSVSVLFDSIEFHFLRDEIMNKFILLLSIFYKVDFSNSKNTNGTYDWEYISEVVCSELL